MERRSERGRDKSRDSSDSRTPLAWQQRDFTFKERYPDLQGGHSSSSERYSHPSIGSRSARSASRGARRSSERESRATNKAPSTAASRNNQPSSEETTTGSSSETESDSQERAQRSRPGTSGTLRSVQSMPLLTPLQLHGQFNPMLGGIYGVGMVGMAPTSTWNGEPCPVHGSTLPQATPFPISVTPYPGYAPIYSSMSMRRTASIHELALATPLPAAYPHQAIYATLPHQSAQPMLSMPPATPMLMLPPPGRPGQQLRGPPPSRQAGSLPPLPPPSLLPPLQRPRPLVVNEKNRQAEPLPVRDAPPLPAKVPPSDASKIPPKGGKKSKPFSYDACCRGNVIVLWAILAVIAFGIVIGVVFHFAFKPPS